VEKSPTDWPRRNEALAGWLFSLDQAGDGKQCITVGRAHLAEVTGAAVPADYAGTLLGCAGDGSASAEAKAAREKPSRACATSPPRRPPMPAPTIAPTPGTSCPARSPTRRRSRRDEAQEGAWRCSTSRRRHQGPAARADLRLPARAGLRDAQAWRRSGEDAGGARRDCRIPTSRRRASCPGEDGEVPEALVAIDRAIAKSTVRGSCCT
jgi:hypothetical protein